MRLTVNGEVLNTKLLQSIWYFGFDSYEEPDDKELILSKAELLLIIGNSAFSTLPFSVNS